MQQKYTYTASRADGEVVQGTILAPSMYVARRTIQAEIGRVVTLEEVELRDPVAEALASRAAPNIALALYTRQFCMLLRSGVSLPRALEVLAMGDSEQLNGLFQVISKDVERGRSLSRSMKRFPKVFDALYVTMIEAAEVSGHLDSLDKLADVLERGTVLQKRIVAALAYPMCIAVVSMAVLGIFVLFVMPGLEEGFASLGAQLPFVTRAVLWVTGILRSRVMVLGFVALCMVGARVLRQRLATVQGRRDLDDRVRRVPLLGTVLAHTNAARVLYILSVLLDSGIMLDTALDVAGRAGRDYRVEMGLYRARLLLREGETLGTCLETAGIFPPMVLHMLTVGEETGRLGYTMQCACEILERNVERTLDSLATTLEPIIMIVVGLIVAVIAAAAFLPNIAMLETL